MGTPCTRYTSTFYALPCFDYIFTVLEIVVEKDKLKFLCKSVPIILVTETVFNYDIQ